MKKEYADLSVEEKKEYHLLKNLTLEIPYFLGIIFASIFALPVAFKYSIWVYMLAIMVCFIIVYSYYSKDKKEFKKLFGL